MGEEGGGEVGFILGKLDSAWGGGNEEKLEEGDNSRGRISVNDSEMGGKEKSYRSCFRYYWSVGSGARKHMGFLGLAHDESWSTGWHIILLINSWTESWKKKEPTRFKATSWIYHNRCFQVFKISGM